MLRFQFNFITEDHCWLCGGTSMGEGIKSKSIPSGVDVGTCASARSYLEDINRLREKVLVAGTGLKLCKLRR
jgi:hypothetical protein